jgi:HTH-type transcriptional regulator/antitoxin HigA
MDIQEVIRLAQELQTIMPFGGGIHTREQYDEAIEMMDVLVDDAKKNDLLIDYLFPIFEAYENTAPEFKEWDAQIEAMDMEQTVLRVLMDHHGLNTTDFADEIGSKTVVSLIANGKRQLTIQHIKNLSARFNLSPAVFFRAI